MPEMVPLREFIEAHHRQTQSELSAMRRDLRRIERKLDTHGHADMVTWRGLIGTLVAIGGIVGAALGFN